MATFFGEVILPSSRAFFDDFDDEGVEDGTSDNQISSNRPTLTLKTHCEVGSTNFEELIFSFGKVAKGFAQLCMPTDKSILLAEIEVVKEEQRDSTDVLIYKAKRVESTKLYLMPNNTLFLQLSDAIDLGMSNEVTLHLKPWLNKCKRVISIASYHIANYRCDSVNELPPAFVRSLSTSSITIPQNLKRLEQPNFISHIPASVMTWCEAQRIPGLLLVLYSDQEVVEELTLKPLLQAFNEAGLSHLILNQPTFPISSDTLRNMDKSFMYM